MKLAQLKKDAAFGLGILRGRPFQVLIQVSNRCNMKCSFCDFWPNVAPRAQELSAAEYARIADELSELGTFLVSVEGGEPLLRPDILEVVSAFAKQHVPVLFTNGWHINPERAKALFASGLVHASVSIDYARAEQHDRKRGLPGTWERAWRAVATLRDAAPHGGKQVHVMTVLMKDNAADLEALLQQSAKLGVGHQVTLLSTAGFRRKPGTPGENELPPPGTGEAVLALWRRYPHLRYFRDYFARMDAFLGEGELPVCRAGVQSFNIDHVGNVSPCIEKIDLVAGNVRQESLPDIHRRLVAQAEQDVIAGCRDCWTACRGFVSALGDGGTVQGFRDMSARMRSW